MSAATSASMSDRGKRAAGQRRRERGENAERVRGTPLALVP